MNRSISALLLTGLWGAGIFAACTAGGEEAPAAVDPAAAQRYVASLGTADDKPAVQPIPTLEARPGKRSSGIKLSKETVQRIDRSEPMIGAVLTVAR